MKIYIYYFIILTGITAIISEVIYDFKEVKFLYATFFPEKYFKKDELTNWKLYNISGSEGTDFSMYRGQLKSNINITVQQSARESLITSLILENGNIPIWFMQIGKAKYSLWRKSKEYPSLISKEAIKPITYIFFFLYSFIAIYRLIKLKNKS